MRKGLWYGRMIIAVLFLIVLGGCGKSETPTDSVNKADTEKPVSSQPVTIKYADGKDIMSEEDFKRYVSEPLKKKYPHITLDHIDLSQKGNSITELVAANNIPDIFMSYPDNLAAFQQAELLFNMDDLLKQYKFELNRITPEFLDAIKFGVFKEYLSSLPVNNNAFGLLYNKNLFDRFGVAYPKDNMTWEEMRNLAAKLTRNVDGVQYIGLHPDTVPRGARQLALPWFDVKTDKATFQSKEWKDLIEMWLGLYKFSGNDVIPKGTNLTKGFTEGTIGMISGYTAILSSVSAVKDLQWDVVTYPINPKAPGVGGVANPIIGAITSTSKHKTEALQVLSVLLSDEVQLDMSRHALMSVLKDRKVQDQFGQDITAYQSKNMVAFTKLKLAVPQPYKYAINPASIISNSFNTMLYDGKDINTALREADELMDKAIQTALNK